MKHSIRSPYNFDRSKSSNETGTENSEPSLTIQSAAEETDINVLLRRFGVTGQLPVIEPPPSLSDFADVFDFQSAMNLIRESEEAFAALDPLVRSRFNNSPHNFVNFCEDPDNIPEMRKMGLVLPEPPAIIDPPPTKVEIVNPQPPVKGST